MELAVESSTAKILESEAENEMNTSELSYYQGACKALEAKIKGLEMESPGDCLGKREAHDSDDKIAALEHHLEEALKDLTKYTASMENTLPEFRAYNAQLDSKTVENEELLSGNGVLKAKLTAAETSVPSSIASEGVHKLLNESLFHSSLKHRLVQLLYLSYDMPNSCDLITHICL